MLVSEFSEERLNMGYAQFAIGIALSQLNESKASSAVIEFLGTNVSSNSSVEKIIEERKKIEDEIETSGADMITGLLTVLNRPECIPIVKKGGVHGVASRVSLSELLSPGFNQNLIYTRVMSILRKESKLKLIAVFMDTEEYKKSFKLDISKKYRLSADKHRANDISNSIIEEIRRSFREYVYVYSTGGVYNPITGTPIAFLRNAFNTFFDVGNNNKVHQIFNTIGTNADVGGDSDMALIDFQGVSAKKENESIDFIDIANKIQKASSLLFSHSSSDVAFLDILSCYRDNLMQSRLKQDKAQFAEKLPGCNLIFNDSSSDASGGNTDAYRNKKSSRVNLCKIFTPLVDNGLAQKELYSYFEQVRDFTQYDIHDGKDAKRLFSFGQNTTRHNENNSQMFQIIVSGHLALRELIQYLKREDSIASVYNFPTVIFRNAEYLKRFQTLEEYVTYVSDVSPLVEEVRGDVERSRKEVNGFVSNDTMWEYLGVSNLMNDNIFRKLAKMPLGYITSAVNDSMVLSKDKIFENKFKEMHYCVGEMEKYYKRFLCNGNLTEKYNTVTQFYVWWKNNMLADKSDFFQYAFWLAVYDTIKNTLVVEGKPTCDERGYYLYEAPDVYQELQNTSEVLTKVLNSNDSYNSRYKEQVLYRSMMIGKTLEFFTDEPISGELLCSWQELREFFSIGDLLLALFKQLVAGMTSVQKDVGVFENSAYLTIASMAKSDGIFDLPQIITSCDELTFLYNDENIQEYYINHNKSVEECMDLNIARDKKLIKAVNKFLAIFGEDYESFELANELLEKYVSKSYAPVVIEDKTEIILREAAEVAFSFENATKVDSSIKNVLQAIAPSDEYGYLLVRGERCDLNNDDSYILNNGFVVKLTPSRDNYIFSMLTNADLEKLKYKIDFNNGMKR